MQRKSDTIDTTFGHCDDLHIGEPGPLGGGPRGGGPVKEVLPGGPP